MNAAELLYTLRPHTTSSSDHDAIEAVYAVGHWLLESDRTADAARVFRTMVRVAPADERGWLALGECHERVAQPNIALELYGSGSIAAGGSVRCLVARARLLRKLDRVDDADMALDAATRRADSIGTPELVSLVAAEREVWS